MRSEQEIRGIVDGFAKSGMTRREYCEKSNIRMSTLDSWRRTQKSTPRLVEVTDLSRDGKTIYYGEGNIMRFDLGGVEGTEVKRRPADKSFGSYAISPDGSLLA
jgi:hypothetical protein